MRPSLTIRIFLGFVAMLLVFGGTTLYAVWRMDAIRKDLELTSQGFLQITRSLAQVKTIAESRASYIDRALEESDPRVRQYLVRYARDFYPRVLRERLSALARDARALQRRVARGADGPFVRDVAQRLQRIVDLNAVADEASAAFFDQVAAAAGEIDPGVQQRQREAITALDREIKLLALNLDNKIAQGVLRAERQERQALWAVLVLAAVGILVGAVITVLLTRALRPLHELTQAAHAISRGGFDVRIPDERGGDEIATLARAFNEMASALSERQAVLDRRRVEYQDVSSFLENVLHSVTTGVLVCDRDHSISIANRAARAILGQALVNLEGRALEELPLAHLLAEHQAELQAILDDGPPLSLQRLALSVAESRVLVDCQVLPFRQEGAPSGVGGLVLVLEDVTERESTRDRLLQNERLAAMGRLAAQVAHEIRNPLSSIGLNCELLADDVAALQGPKEAVTRLLASISQEIDRLADLTEGYLQYARLPAASLRPTHVGALVRDVADFVRPEMESQRLRLSVRCQEDLPQISIDPSRVRIALINLLRNAADASPAGAQVELAVELLPAHVRIEVRDHGPGVDEAVRDRLFEPFFTTKSSGTGLGLSVTRDVAREHGGEASFEPGLPEGSIFAITLAIPRSDGGGDQHS